MDTSSILNGLKEFFINFYHSSAFSVIKVFLSIYVIILIIDVILIIFARGTGADIRTIMKGIDMPAGSKGKMTRRWLKIMKRLESGEDSQYKAAVLEAHAFVDEILKGIGYKGKNMAERLEQIKPGQFDNVDDLWKAHKIRNQIIKESSFQVDLNLAKEIIEIYENLLKSLEFI